MLTVIAVLAAIAVVLALALGFSRRLLNRDQRVAHAVIRDPEESTVVDAQGAVRSTQGADITLPASELEALWAPRNLERLARTYWRFLSRCTLGLIRVHYTERERFVVLIGRPLVLLSFHAPEYEMDADHGVVRWRIDKGVLVARSGRGGDGHLQIDVRRCPPEADGRAKVHVAVEVANFYPSIASGIGQWVYRETQSRIHVIVTHGFLRSLARLDLAESRVGRFATIEELPDPPAPAPDSAPAERPRAVG